MRTNRVLGALVITAAFMTMAGGCMSSKVVRYQKGDEPRIVNAPRTGTYGLYKSIKRMSPMFTYHLERGAPVGFQQKGDQVVAVAGPSQLVLGDRDDVGTYTWRAKK